MDQDLDVVGGRRRPGPANRSSVRFRPDDRPAPMTDGRKPPHIAHTTRSRSRAKYLQFEGATGNPSRAARMSARADHGLLAPFGARHSRPGPLISCHKQDRDHVEQVEPLYLSEQIAHRVDELAAEIVRILPESFTVVGLLKGAFMLTADLVRALDRAGRQPMVEFLQVSSYGLDRQSSGRVRVIGEMPGSVGGRDVLLVDDIQDSGRTLAFTRQLLLDHGARQVWSLALLDKPSRRAVPFEADFIGWTIPDVFIVGYGIDYAERYRHLPYIGRIL
jgi:hypoxanthine phosphoribosyltransferase